MPILAITHKISLTIHRKLSDIALGICVRSPWVFAQMPRRPSVHSKLVLLVLAAVGACMAVATSVALWQQASSYGEMRKQALVATAQVFAAAAGPPTAARNGSDAFLALRAI